MKACGTRESGYLAKKLLAACQTEYLGEPGSDCGTKRGIPISITDDNYKDYVERYIKVNGKNILVDLVMAEKLIGKTVEMRSPLSCIRMQKTGHICNICAGNFYYKLGQRSIGLTASRIGNDLTRLNMKKFHDNVIKLKEIDPSDEKMFV